MCAQLALAAAVERWVSLSSEAPAGIHIVHPIIEPMLPKGPGCISMPYYICGNLLRYHLNHPQVNLLPIVSYLGLVNDEVYIELALAAKGVCPHSRVHPREGDCARQHTGCV